MRSLSYCNNLATHSSRIKPRIHGTQQGGGRARQPAPRTLEGVLHVLRESSSHIIPSHCRLRPSLKEKGDEASGSSGETNCGLFALGQSNSDISQKTFLSDCKPIISSKLLAYGAGQHGQLGLGAVLHQHQPVLFGRTGAVCQPVHPPSCGRLPTPGSRVGGRELQ